MAFESAEASNDPASSTRRYQRLLEGLRYAVHELPAGVLYGANGASAKQCLELLDDLNEFERLCSRLGKDHGPFIEGCRWHFEHYPHYIGRRRHFSCYEAYIVTARDRYGFPHELRIHESAMRPRVPPSRRRHRWIVELQCGARRFVP